MKNCLRFQFDFITCDFYSDSFGYSDIPFSVTVLVNPMLSRVSLYTNICLQCHFSLVPNVSLKPRMSVPPCLAGWRGHGRQLRPRGATQSQQGLLINRHVSLGKEFANRLENVKMERESVRKDGVTRERMKRLADGGTGKRVHQCMNENNIRPSIGRTAWPCACAASRPLPLSPSFPHHGQWR